MDGTALAALPRILDALGTSPIPTIIFADDISFRGEDDQFKVLKAVLDGSLSGPPAHVRIYATSNRRHLTPEYFAENAEFERRGGEIHPGETSDEKLSLADRFGLWLGFYAFDQAMYLQVVDHWCHRLGVDDDLASRHRAALAWSRRRGSRNGRIAWQFAVDWLARCSVESDQS